MTGIVARVIERSGWVIEAGEGGARSSAGSEITDALGANRHKRDRRTAGIPEW